jgi:hypothetical protein
MSRPCILTPEQIAAIPARVQAGQSRASIAREYGVSNGAILYHPNGKGARVIGLPWTVSLRTAQQALNRRDLKAASKAFAEASQILERAN